MLAIEAVWAWNSILMQDPGLNVKACWSRPDIDNRNYIIMDVTSEEHYRKLEWMYVHAAPINKIYKPTMKISKGYCEISMACDPELFHAAGALHGSVYFKMLDDAAFFASSSMETNVFLLTSTFNIYFLRPVLYGDLMARAELVSHTKQHFVAEAKLINLQTDKEVARGTGTFMRSNITLDEKVGYRSAAQ